MSQAEVTAITAFIRDQIVPLERDRRAGGHGPTDALVQEMRQAARSAGLLTPQRYPSGKRRSLTEMAPLFAAAGRSPLGPVALNCMAPDEGNMHLLEEVASEAQKSRYLTPLLAGHIRSAFLMTEPADGAGSDPSMLATIATPDGAGWRIHGRKLFITGVAGAAFGIVMARTQTGATLFLVDLPDPAVRIERVLDTIDGSMPGGHAEVVLDGAFASADAVLGEVGRGFAHAQVRLAPARLTHCMRWSGLARRAHEEAIDYACRRQAFGRPLIEHEGVGFMLADNEIDLRQSDLMIDWCAGVLDAGMTGTMESSMTKVAVSEALFRVADRSVQVLGGGGVSRDRIAETAFRELRAFRIYDGPSEVHRWSLAKRLQRTRQA